MSHVSLAVLTPLLTLINAGVRGLVGPGSRCFPHSTAIGCGAQHCSTVALMAPQRKMGEVSSTFTQAALLSADSVLIREHNTLCALCRCNSRRSHSKYERKTVNEMRGD